MRSQRVMIGINPEDLAAPRFSHYWSTSKGMVQRPTDAATFFDQGAAVMRTRKLRCAGYRAFVITERSAPWLFAAEKPEKTEEPA